MFNLREFIKSGFIDAVGKMADYQVVLNAAGWFEKGVLLESDLSDIQAAIDAARQPETPSDEEMIDTETPETGAEETEDEPETVKAEPESDSADGADTNEGGEGE